jgi:hypothetical protein
MLLLIFYFPFFSRRTTKARPADSIGRAAPSDVESDRARHAGTPARPSSHGVEEQPDDDDRRRTLWSDHEPLRPRSNRREKRLQQRDVRFPASRLPCQNS